MAKAPTTAPKPVRTEPTRLPNAYTPGVAHEGEPDASSKTVIKLWNGGERRRAADLAKTLSLSAEDEAAVRAACPGWDELAGR